MLMPERLNVIHRGRNPSLLSYRKRTFKSVGRSVSQLLKGWRPQVDSDIACPASCCLAGQSAANIISYEQ